MASFSPARLLRLVLLALVLLPWLVGQTPASQAMRTGPAGEAHDAARQPAPPPPPADPQAQHTHRDMATGEAIPSLKLTWAGDSEETHVGAPVDLLIQALDPEGRPDTGRSATVHLLVDDDNAQVAPAGAGQAPLGGLPVSAGPAGPAQRFTVPLGGGAARLTVTFATPGRHTMQATLADDLDIAGESEPLAVRDTFLVIQGPPTARQGEPQRFTVVAQDEHGRPVAGFAGTAVVEASDPGAEIGYPGAGERRERGAAARRLQPGDQGRAPVEVVFAGSGGQSIEVRHAEAPDRRAEHAVTVAAAEAGPRPAATATAAATATPAAAPAPTASPGPRAAVSPTPTPSPTVTTTTHAHGAASPTATVPAVAPTTATPPAADAGVPAVTATPTPSRTATPPPGARTTPETATVPLLFTSNAQQSALQQSIVSYLSDVDWTSASNGWGPVERDMSVGEKAAGDGRPITLNGAVYAKGLGTHALADIRYNLEGICSTFTADVGVDDEVSTRGSVTFQVWADGVQVSDSGVMTGATATKTVSLSVGGVTELRLVVTDGGNGGSSDHADWADARVSCSRSLGVSTERFAVTVNTVSGNAGAPLHLTVQALAADGTINTGYRGTVKLTSTDPLFAPGTAYRYTFTATDAGQHVFPVTFNTASAAQTVTVTATASSTITGTSPAVAVAETYLHASFAAPTATQGVGINLTVQAKDSGGALVTGYQGRVRLAASWNDVHWTHWGAGVDSVPSYTFTAADGGSHVFTPPFKYAGDQTVTVTDMVVTSRTVTAPIVVTNSPAAAYGHQAAPTGVKLADGSLVWAFVGVRGRLYVRRNVGTLTEPAWRPLVRVREEADSGGIGADTPSLVRFGPILALFHTFTDGTYYQAWLTTSTDDGATWSAPTQVTQEAGHVQRLQAVVSGGTVYLFWSRQDTNQKLFYRTSTDLATWSATAAVGQAIGVPIGNTTPNFGLTRLAAGGWLLGWIAPSAYGEGGAGPNNLTYPTVHVATAADLANWSSPTELNRPVSEAGARSVAVAQDPDTALIYALFESDASSYDTYIVRRTSTDGAIWTPKSLVGYDHAAPTDGNQRYRGRLPTLVPGSMAAAASVQVGASLGGTLQPYGTTACTGVPDRAMAVPPLDVTNPQTETLPIPLTADPRAPACATEGCNTHGQPVNALTGYLWTSATDLAVPARGGALVVQRTYTSYDGVLAVHGPFGYGWSWSYGVRAIPHGDGSVTIVEATGRRALFVKTGSGWSAPLHVSATLAAGAGGGYVLTRHDQGVWTFDQSGKLLSIADRNGNVHTLSYTGNVLSAISAPGGRTLSLTADGQGRITAISGPGGLSSSYTYDAAGNLATATDAAGAVTTYSYDGRHQLLTVTDGNGHSVETNTYGTLGRVTAQRDAAGGVTRFAVAEQGISGNGDPHKVTDPRGQVTTYYNDGALRVTRRQGPHGRAGVKEVRWTYDAAGNPRQVQAGWFGVEFLHTTAFTFDDRGNVLTVTRDPSPPGDWRALHLTTRFTYSSTNDLLTATDPLGHTTTFTYDSRGNRLTAADALGHTTTYGYDAAGELTSVTDATNHTTTFGYNAAGDLTSITVAGGAAWTLGYDGAGRVTSVTDPLGHSTSLSVDGLGRVTSVTNALNQTTSVAYDAAGNRTRVTDALGRATSYGYDALDRLTSVTDALGQTTTYAYDATSNLTGVTNALGRAWSYTYDTLNRPATAADPLGQTTTYSYDGTGQLTQVRKPDGVTIRLVYDRVGRLSDLDLGNDGSLDIRAAYDAASRRTSLTDGTGTTTYAYDTADRLSSTTAPGTGTLSYGYDAAGRRTSLSYPSGRQVSYGYSDRGELASVTDWGSRTTNYTYDAAGRLTGMALPNGVRTTLEYDPADRLTALTHAKGGTTLEALQYVLNAAGNRTSMTDSAGTTTWGYDALDRLTEARYPNGDVVGYGYDAVGNRTSLTRNGTTTTNTFDAANRLTASGADSYTYDANGNQTGKTAGGVTTTYSYDALDRLTGIGGPVTASYAYNGDGLRVSKTVGGTTTNYAWDVLGLPMVLSDGTEYVWGHGLISQITGAGAATYAHADGLGSIRVLTDGSGTVVGTQQYDAFGAGRGQSGAQLPFGYTGEQVDAESGLVYLRARYMDPATGRFLTVDPFPGFLDDLASQHAYAYVGNNPLRWVDPTGEDAGVPLFDSEGGSGIGPSGPSSGRGIRPPRIRFSRPQQLRLPGFDDLPTIRAPRPNMPKLHGHHTIPKEILGKLPPAVRKSVMGRRG